MIYRIAEASDWTHAQQTGEFASADLHAEGFIHCSDKHQILRTAAKYYAGKKSLMLLEIDETKVMSNLRREDTTGRGEIFPHVYAPIPLTAIARHIDFREIEGAFVLPF